MLQSQTQPLYLRSAKGAQSLSQKETKLRQTFYLIMRPILTSYPKLTSYSIDLSESQAQRLYQLARSRGRRAITLARTALLFVQKITARTRSLRRVFSTYSIYLGPRYYQVGRRGGSKQLSQIVLRTSSSIVAYQLRYAYQKQITSTVYRRRTNRKYSPFPLLKL